MKQEGECGFRLGKKDYLDLRQDGLRLSADIGFPKAGEQFSSVVIFPEVPCKRINNDFNVWMALRRTRMLGNGCKEAFLIDGYLLQMPMTTEEIMGRVNVL
jgi:hypothetical protein